MFRSNWLSPSSANKSQKSRTQREAACRHYGTLQKAPRQEANFLAWTASKYTNNCTYYRKLYKIMDTSCEEWWAGSRLGRQREGWGGSQIKYARFERLHRRQLRHLCRHTRCDVLVARNRLHNKITSCGLPRYHYCQGLSTLWMFIRQWVFSFLTLSKAQQGS
jgi:hypothetical protein